MILHSDGQSVTQFHVFRGGGGGGCVFLRHLDCSDHCWYILSKAYNYINYINLVSLKG